MEPREYMLSSLFYRKRDDELFLFLKYIMKGRKNMIKITLKDGSVREVAKGSSILDDAKSIS